MKPTMKRALMTHMNDKDRREREEMDMRGGKRNYGRMEYDGGMYSHYNDDMEDKFRDRRGREHYDNGRYAPMDSMLVEDRQGRDSRGRYTARNAYDDNMRDNYYPYVPPVYERSRREEYRPMNKIGFSVDGEMERMPNEAHHDYKSDAWYNNMNETAYRSGERTNGYGMSNGHALLTKQMAMEWTEQMDNVDGTHGAHWTIEQVKQVMAQKGIECDPWAFYVALNMVYSDYSKVAKELGVNNLDFYVKMAKAFLDDPDSVDGSEKLARYYEYVVK